jgi:hypothetical protein
MDGMVFETAALSESLHKYIKTPTVKVYQEPDRLVLVPQNDEPKHKYNCKFFGIFQSETSIVDEFLAEKQKEREFE